MCGHQEKSWKEMGSEEADEGKSNQGVIVPCIHTMHSHHTCFSVSALRMHFSTSLRMPSYPLRVRVYLREVEVARA